MADTKISAATTTTPQVGDLIPIARPGSPIPLNITWQAYSNTYTAGTGLTLTGGTQFNIASTGVTPGTYTLASLTVNQYGQLTGVSAAATTGTGEVVLQTAPTLNSPTLVTPALGAATAIDLYIGYSGDQGGGQPLQVNGGALFNGPIVFPAVYGADIPAISFNSTITSATIGNPGSDVGYLFIEPVLNGTGSGTDYANIVGAHLGLALGANNTQPWNNVGASYTTFYTVVGATGAIGTAGAGANRIIHVSGQQITTAVVLSADFSGTSGNITNAFAMYAANAFGNCGPVTNAVAGAFYANNPYATNLCDLLLGTGTPPSGKYAMYGANTAPSVLAGPFAAATLGTSVPITVTTATYTMGALDSDLIIAGQNCVVTLLSAAANPGRELNVKNLASGYSLTSASSNVVPQTSQTPGTAILAAAAGKWSKLKSDGANWVVMQSN